MGIWKRSAQRAPEDDSDAEPGPGAAATTERVSAFDKLVPVKAKDKVLGLPPLGSPPLSTPPPTPGRPQASLPDFPLPPSTRGFAPHLLSPTLLADTDLPSTTGPPASLDPVNSSPLDLRTVSAPGAIAILLVGDDLQSLGLVAEDLGRDGHSVLTLEPERAMRAQLSTDVSLSVLDGLESATDRVDLFRHLISDCDVPCAVVDHSGSVTEQLLWLALGARDVLTNPVSPHGLAEQVRALARRPLPATSDDHLVLGDISLDLNTRDVKGPRGRSRLTKQEALLLEFFMEHPGEVFSRAQLLERVWGHNVGKASTVAVHVRRLREKIEVDPSNPSLLVTIWGAGYCLDPEKI